MRPAADKNNPHVTWRLGRGLEERGQEEFDQQSVADEVDSEVPLKSFISEGGARKEGTGVAYQDIETIGEEGEI